MSREFESHHPDCKKGCDHLDKERLYEEIKEIESYIKVLDTQCINDEERVIKAYIMTEGLAKKKKEIDKQNIVMPSGKKYQINDIRDLVLRGVAGDHAEELNELAYRIYQTNKRKGGQWQNYAKSRTYQR